MMNTAELNKHLACIEDHLLRWGWDSWDFELTNTTRLYAPWSNPPVTETRPNDRVLARYILKDAHRQSVAFCLAELESERLEDIGQEKGFHKLLASFHATLEQLPLAMYTHRGWVWDYQHTARGHEWHEEDPHLSTPLDPAFVDRLMHPGHQRIIQ